ncbi:MAG TPA: diadenylate cyclase CdaA [Anaerolineae bacterium]|nr:diadenylate cyclase CdaA [Anaerolineae bacterium]
MADLLAVLDRLEWGSLLDIALVALVFFGALTLVRGTQADTLLRGVLTLVVIGALLGSAFSFPALGWLLSRAGFALLVAIPVIFQPELRRALERLGRAGPRFGQTARDVASIESVISAVAQTATRLADRRQGALIVLERETGLQSYADTGVRLDAEVTPELLQTVFYTGTMLHDGAAIIRQDRILAAACILPLTSAFLSDRRMGLRHRAAIGITESTDAVAVVVSEEHGHVSIAHNGRLIRRIEPRRLEDVLRTFYQSELKETSPRWLSRLRLPRLTSGRRQSPTRPSNPDR